MPRGTRRIGGGGSEAADVKSSLRASDGRDMTASSLTSAGLTLALAISLAVYVALQRDRSLLGWLVLALLGSTIAWTLGYGVVLLAEGDVEAQRWGLRILYAGVMLAPPLWLFLSARLARMMPAVEQPRASLAALFTPTAFLLVAMWTDASHGLFASGQGAAQFTQAVADWAGPLFWVHVFWAYTCTVAGILCCALAARRTASRLERRRLALVGSAAAVPLLTTLTTLLAWMPEDIRLMPIDLALSSVLLVTAIVRDRLLEASPLAAREVIAELKDGLILADEKTRVVDANATALQLLDVSLSEIQGEQLVETLTRLDPGGRIDPASLCEHVRDGRLANLRLGPTAAGRILEASCTWVESGLGARGFISVLHDRTELDRHEQTRQRSQRLESLGVVAAGIAHEINNPLAWVRANLAHVCEIAEAAKRAGPPPPHLPRDLQDDWGQLPDVIQEAQHGLEQIARIVDSTRRLSRHASPEMQPVDLHRILDDVLLITGLGLDGAVRIETEREPTLPCVQGASESLAQVLLNLLINARQAASPRGLVRVETRSTPETVEIAVSDDGPGIPAELYDRVFDPFFTTKGPEEGTGLGLAISHEIATVHGGSLEIESGPLRGACFRLRLPRLA